MLSIMKNKVKVYAILAIVVGIVFAYLDIMPVACLLWIVGGAVFLVVHYSDKRGGSQQNNEDRDDYTLTTWWWLNNH